MAKFKLEDYEPVENRIAKFKSDHPGYRIFTEIISALDSDECIFKASLYDDPISERPVSTGYASETRGAGFVNKTSHIENCETSAIGRALANYGYHGNKRPSREEMSKVQRTEQSSPLNGTQFEKKEKRPPSDDLMVIGQELIAFGKFKDKTVAEASQSTEFIDYVRYLGQENNKKNDRFKESNRTKYLGWLRFAESVID